MKKEQDGFILLDRVEFKIWLSDQIINRGIVRIQNHHTFKPDYSSFKGDNHFSLLSGMKNYHVNNNNWRDIAQNFTSFPDGTIAVCRSLEEVPVGIKGANTGGICIEHIGNFDIGGDIMKPEHRNTIIEINALLCQKFLLTPNTESIVYHHWYDLNSGIRKNGLGITKTCPGTNFFGSNKVEYAEKFIIPLISHRCSTPLINEEATKKEYSSGQVNTFKLNVRSGPGVKSPVIDSIYRGSSVTIYEKQEDWLRIGTDQKWVSAEYITIKK